MRTMREAEKDFKFIMPSAGTGSDILPFRTLCFGLMFNVQTNLGD